MQIQKYSVAISLNRGAVNKKLGNRPISTSWRLQVLLTRRRLVDNSCDPPPAVGEITDADDDDGVLQTAPATLVPASDPSADNVLPPSNAQAPTALPAPRLLTKAGFPGYPWEEPTHQGVRHTFGPVPTKLSATGTKDTRWTYEHPSFYGLRWYWGRLERPTDLEHADQAAGGAETTITHLQPARNFQLSTHLELGNDDFGNLVLGNVCSFPRGFSPDAEVLQNKAPMSYSLQNARPAVASNHTGLGPSGRNSAPLQVALS